MSAFGEAFKAARAAGKKEFSYKGKQYNTRTKDDEAKSSKKNTAAVSKDAAKKIEARAKTPNTETKVTAKAPKKAKTTDSKAGQAYKRMAGGDGVPGKSKPKPRPEREPGRPAPKKDKPKAKKASPGDNYKRMAASKDGVPGKKKKAKKKGIFSRIFGDSNHT